MVDLKIGHFLSKVDSRANSTNYNSTTEPLRPPSTGSQRWGFTASNTSRFLTDFGDFALEYGGAFTREDAGLLDGVTYDSRRMRLPRQGSREEFSAYASPEWKPLYRGYRVGWQHNEYSSQYIGGIMPSKWETYTLVDLYGSDKVNENATLDFAVDNVTDRYYVDALSTVGVPAPERTFRAGFKVKF